MHHWRVRLETLDLVLQHHFADHHLVVQLVPPAQVQLLHPRVQLVKLVGALPLAPGGRVVAVLLRKGRALLRLGHW